MISPEDRKELELLGLDINDEELEGWIDILAIGENRDADGMRIPKPRSTKEKEDG